jgi:hypothetical protein
MAGLGMELPLCRERPTCIPSHAFTQEQIQAIKDDYINWELEDGYPCAHRRIKQYFITPGTTWTRVHEQYYDRVAATGIVPASYDRWRQYIRAIYPSLRLCKAKEDECDACIRLKMQLEDNSLDPEARAAIEEELALHMNAAIEQRRIMQRFIRELVRKHDPDQQEPELPETAEDEVRDENEQHGTPTVMVQAEDFGGGLTMPHYGFRRPSADYYSSNLIIQNFVIANINDNVNNVWLFDERAQDKGADCMCSLRMRYHLRQLDRYKLCNKRPSVSVSVLDNCVGQNKSNITMKFNAMLSLLFYDKVVLLYLISGHSHMIADRVVAWIKGSLKNGNYYCPKDFAAVMNTVKSVHAEFLDHSSSKRPFFINWHTILDKYFKDMPAQFTFNFFFEFDKGDVTVRHLVSTPDEDCTTISLVRGNKDAVRKAILKELFGVTQVTELSERSLDTMQLPRHPGNVLSGKKVLSLSTKYFSIPENYRPYYPTPATTSELPVPTIDATPAAAGDPVHTPPVPAVPKRSRAAPAVAGKRGRLKVVNAIDPAQQSILSFFA